MHSSSRVAYSFRAVVIAIVALFATSLFSTATQAATILQRGEYIKGEHSSDVYVIDVDNRNNLVRRAFINEQIFFTWQSNFRNVITVSDKALASFMLGPIVLPKSGVVLVKIQSVNNVYAVDNATLRWITTEAIAKNLYGSNWAAYVIDLPATAFPHFTAGSTITTASPPPNLTIMKPRVALVASTTDTVAVAPISPVANAAPAPTTVRTTSSSGGSTIPQEVAVTPSVTPSVTETVIMAAPVAVEAPVTVAVAEAPATVPTVVANPFTSTSLYVDRTSSVNNQIATWSTTRATDAIALEKIASQPTARWFGDWNNDIQSSVDRYVTTVTATGALPVLVAYNIPNRDCGSYSAGGSSTQDAYRTWISNFAAGIGTRAAIVILEPDATATSCVTNERLALLADAVRILKAQPHVAVYIDAGHDNWIPAATMATRLQAAGVADADGFALNVSNFYTTAENTTYGTAVSKLIGGKHFVIDTSRNGNGWNGEWCNPSGRKIGTPPTTDTGNVLIDALLWVKPPGESDGTCNGGPSAGAWWPEYALGLMQ